MYLFLRHCPDNHSRAPYGARGLKLIVGLGIAVAVGRAPYGARGLKFQHLVKVIVNNGSRPVWGAWIEIFTNMS